MTVNFVSRRAAATDIVSLIFYPEQLFQREEPEVLKAIGVRNTILHHEFGLDNRSMVAWSYKNWTIEGIPDQILEDIVVEGKVVSPNSNINILAASAWIQGFIYAKALGLEKYKIILFNKNLETIVERTFSVRAEEQKILFFIDRAIGVLEAIRALNDSGKRAHNLITQNSLLEVRE